VILSPVRSEEQVKDLVPIDLDMLQFVGESLKILQNEVMPIYISVLYVGM
jgi:uroporphyrinogen decarboxylase